MEALTELLARSAAQHHQLCPRQVLGVRMGMLAGRLLALDLPQRDKRLFAFLETDGCTVDGVSAATGCSIGRRTMRVIDFGKVAATFVDRQAGRALRIHPHPAARERGLALLPHAESRWHAQQQAYQTMPDGELLVAQPVSLEVDLDAIISRPGPRVTCAECGEEVINEREVRRDGRVVCRACAGEAYYGPA